MALGYIREEERLGTERGLIRDETSESGPAAGKSSLSKPLAPPEEVTNQADHSGQGDEVVHRIGSRLRVSARNQIDLFRWKTFGLKNQLPENSPFGDWRGHRRGDFFSESDGLFHALANRHGKRSGR